MRSIIDISLLLGWWLFLVSCSEKPPDIGHSVNKTFQSGKETVSEVPDSSMQLYIRLKSGRQKRGCAFIDDDGDGYNDYAPDHDNDGIPDGLDPDWRSLRPGKGWRVKQRTNCSH